MISPLFVSLTLLDALLLWILIYMKRGWWWAKLLLIVVVIGFNLLSIHVTGTGKGWPTVQEVPKTSIFIWCVVEEPDTQKGDPGSIFLWLIPEGQKHAYFGYNSNPGAPRAFRFPYTRALHKECAKAQNATTHGQGPLEVKRGAPRNGHGQRSPKLHFYKLPIPGADLKGK